MKYFGLFTLLAALSSASAVVSTGTCEPDLLNDAAADQFQADPITILSQDTTTVTFTVSQTWSDDLLCLIGTLYLTEEDGYDCPSVANAGPGEFANYTAQCVDGTATVELYVYDPSFVLSDSPAIDGHCEQSPPEHTYKYVYEIPCTATDECPAPVTCAEVASTSFDFENTAEADVWLFGKIGGEGTSNQYLQLDSDTVEISKTFDAPADDTTSATFQFDFLSVESLADDQLVLIRVGDYYLNLTSAVKNLLMGDNRKEYFGDIEVDTTRLGFSTTIRATVKIPARMYAVGHIALGVRSTGGSVVGVDNVSLTLECEDTFGGTTKAGGGGGDPHFQRWDREHGSFHGECDLVMVHSDKFQSGAGLDLHVRTTIEDYFSYIEIAALRVGESIVEFHQDHFYLDGVKYAPRDLPLTFGNHVTISNGVVEAGKNPNYYQYFQVDLNEHSSMLFKYYKKFLTIDVNGHAKDFNDSVGLLGDYKTGNMLSRYGAVMSDFDQYGFEWQVNPGDAKLFREDRGPQLPYEPCRMPTAARPARKLRGADAALYESAAAACAHVSGSDVELCVEDVLATGDIGLASMW